MKNRSNYFIKNTAIFAIGEMGTKLINFFLVPFYTYVLSAEQYGTVDLIFTICIVIVPLVMFNIGEAIMRYALDKNADINKIFSIGATAILFGSVISLLIFPVMSVFPLLSDYSVYIYLYVVFCAAKSVITGFLRGKEQLGLYVSCNLLNTFLIAVFNILFLVVFKKGIEGYLTAYILAEVVAVLFAFFAGKVYKHIKYFTIDKPLAKEMMKFSLAVIPTSLLWWVINSSDRVMVTAMCGTAENGILAVGYKLPSLLTMINTILMQAWKYSAIKEDESSDRDDFTNRSFARFAGSSVLIAAALILVIRPLTGLLFESEYYTAWQPSLYLLFGFVFMGLSTFVGTVYYVKKDMVGNMLSSLVGAVMNVILNFVFIPIMGASGATLAACISYFVILIYRWFDTKKYQSIRLVSVKNIAMLLLLCLMTVAVALNTVWATVVAAAAFIVLVVINFETMKELIKKAKFMIKRKGSHERDVTS